MSKMIIKVSGSQEQIRNFTDFLPLEVVDSVSNKLPSKEKPTLFHRFLKVDDVLFDRYFAPVPMSGTDKKQPHINCTLNPDGSHHFSISGMKDELAALLSIACKRNSEFKELLQLVIATADLSNNELDAFVTRVKGNLKSIETCEN